MSARKIRLKRKIRVHPQDLGADICKHIEHKLHRQLEQTWSERHGFIETVEMLPITESGRADSNSGFTEFNVEFVATTHKPQKGEIVSATVQAVTNLGVHFHAGPLKLFMHEKMLPPSYSYIEDTYVCQKTGAKIECGQTILVRIVGTRWTDGEYLSIVEMMQE